jgi:hypothetical protein
MGLGEKNGEEFDQVKVALIPVFEEHVPDEFVLGGHVVVSDHAAVPPRAELHADESSYEMVRGRGYVEGPSSSRDKCGAGLWDGVGRRARADRREGSGGYTRCSRRYWGRNRGGRVRIRVRVR